MIGHYDDVVKICMNGLEKYPNSPYLLYMLGRTLGDIGKTSHNNQKFNEGITILNHVIDLYPNFADAYVERGTIKFNLTNQDGAIHDFLQAKEIEPDIDLPIKFDIKMFDMELKKKEISRRFDELGIINNNYSSGFPQETKTLSKKGVSIVLEYLPECKFDYVLYGSFPLMRSILPAFKRIPGDIDIQLWTSKAEAEKFSKELFHRVKNAGEEVRLNPENLIIIESRKTGKWERAVDIHHTEEVPEDNLSPLYSLDSGTKTVGKREKRKLLIDFLDVFRMMKTCTELAKQNNMNMTKINEAENLIIEWKNLFSEFIDFEKLEIKKCD
jgi:tetratricopeptide (TPR) repeat protein